MAQRLRADHVGVPTVTVENATRDGSRPYAPDPVARIRRLLAAAPGGPTGSGAAPVTAALAAFEAPADIRIRGGLGSGRRTLATALRARRGWQVVVDDLDDLTVPGGAVGATRPAHLLRPPDVEIICLRTAPCRHEEAWVRRHRGHPVLVVATGRYDDDATTVTDSVTAADTDKVTATDTDTDTDKVTAAAAAADNPVPEASPSRSSAPSPRPRWARGLPAVDARSPGDRSVDRVVGFVERALDGLPTVRLARLEAALECLAVHPETGELAEAALCALDH